MRIAQLSDTHLLADPATDRVAALRADCLRQCVAAINRAKPDVVIFTGDTTQHASPDEYHLLQQLLSDLNAPCFIVPGNRDDKRTLRAVFADIDYLTDDSDFFQYAIEINGCRLIGVDSTMVGERKGVFCEQRQGWLREALLSDKFSPTFVFTHHPPFDVGDHYVGGYRAAAHAQAFEEIVHNSQNVRALLCGHVHWPIRCRWAGTEARITPSVAIDLRKGVDEDAFAATPIWSLHALLEDGTLLTRRMPARAVSVPEFAA